MRLFSYGQHDFYTEIPKLLDPTSFKVLLVGDVVGRPGRHAVKRLIPSLRKALSLHVVTINGENLAGGFGITQKIYHEMCHAGVDIITMGNHWKDKPDVHQLRQQYKNLILPQNILGVTGVENISSFLIEDAPGKPLVTLHVINLMGNFAMKDTYGNMFEFLNKHKEYFAQKQQCGSHVIVADIHAEATSEKQATLWLYDGIAAGIMGTHTHTPTADERLTKRGTAFLSDVGMTGAYDSVIGMNAELVIKKLSNPGIKIAHEVASENVWFCGFLVEVQPKTGLSQACYRLQCRLRPQDSQDGEQWTVSKVVS